MSTTFFVFSKIILKQRKKPDFSGFLSKDRQDQILQYIILI